MRKALLEAEHAWTEKHSALEHKYKAVQERRQREAKEYEQHILWYKQETESLLHQMQQTMASKDSLEKEVRSLFCLFF